MQLEDQMSRKELLIAPNYPAHARVDEAKFVSGSVDRFDSREFEVPVRCQSRVNGIVTCISGVSTTWDRQLWHA